MTGLNYRSIFYSFLCFFSFIRLSRLFPTPIPITAMTVINKEAIRIRPYTKDDYDQVADILYAGFAVVGDRQFKHTIKHYTIALGIFLKSVIYTTLIELALLA